MSFGMKDSEEDPSGNDLASALVAALNYIVDLNPAITKITLWSDACIAQNKNSAMSLALIKFLEAHQVEQIIQKFGTPGHSPVQEVDSIHSLIEKRSFAETRFTVQSV